MPKESVIQTNFTAGEISPRLEGRVDLPNYAAGCRTLLNMIVLPHGGVTRRGGTRYITEVKDSTKQVRLIPFEFSTTQAYVLEVGDQYIRFCMDQGQIESGGSPYEIASPYLEAEVGEIQFAQNADTMYIAHPNHVPRKLTRTGHTSWTLSTVATIGGPYGDLNTDAGKTLQPSATTGTGITITAAGHTPFTANDVGRIVSIDHAGTIGEAQITGFTSSTVVTADVLVDFGATTADPDWRLGQWYIGNAPGTVAFYEQRLFWAGTPIEPQTLWASKSADYEDMTIGSAAGDALSYTIATDRVNVIRWLSPGKVLAIGTVGGEFIVSASSLQEAITPTNIRIVRQSTYGSENTMPIRLADQVAFVQHAGRKLRSLGYQFDSDSYTAPDLTIISEHITLGGVIEPAYQQNHDSIVWLVRGDGALIGLTYQKDQEVVAWHRHIIAGDSDAGGTQAKVESITTIPSTTAADGDELWLVVQRYVNGAIQRYIEVIQPGLRDDDTIDEAFFIDSGLSYDGAPTTTFSNLDHLEGETVSVLIDGAVHPDKTVASGSITLDWAGSKVHAGLAYDSDVEPMQLEAGSADGTSQGKIKRISELFARLYRTVGLQAGPDADNLDRVPFRDSSMSMDEAVDLFSGDKRLPFPKGYDREARIYIRQNQPLPLTLLAIMARVKTNNV